MSVIKCKMCGGDLNLVEGASTAECEYCGSVQTIPQLDDEKKLIQFERAERLRKQCEFDKAAGIYETIVADFRQEAEAYWGLVLCKYGIEYVDDPGTGKKIPTCHRSSFDSVLEDSDFEQTLENADPAARKVYREEAKAIEELRKGIIAVSANEQPYDIFICYKETDEKGERTLDSVLAQDVYDALTGKGYRVFFSRISLEDKLGQEYEPYIFAALNSAKIMLAFGTDYEYFSAVWVKNEWSRFLKLMAKDKEKHLIPCYKGIDAYDMPREFNKLQAQDLGKVGAMQDLMRGIEKLLPRQEETTNAVQQTLASGNAGTATLLKRASMFLEDGDWNSANEYCEKVLDIDPENAQAYLGKLLAELNVRKQEELRNFAAPFEASNNYQKALRFADDTLKAELTSCVAYIRERNEKARLDGIYSHAKLVMEKASAETSEHLFKEAAQLFGSIHQYLDAADLAAQCREKAEVVRKDKILRDGKALMVSYRISSQKDAVRLFAAIPGWKDADAQLAACQKKLAELEAQAEADRIEQERQEELARKAVEAREKRIRKVAIIVAAAVLVIGLMITAWNVSILPEIKYNQAVALMEAGEYREAMVAFEGLGDYKDSEDQIPECRYREIVKLMEDGEYEDAIAGFEALGDYKDSADQILACEYGKVAALRDNGNAGDAAIAFYALGDFQDAREQSFALWDKLTVRETVSAGLYHTVGLREDGTVVAVGDNEYGQCDVSDWTDIVAVSAGYLHTVGLRADGTVVAVGANDNKRCDVSGWTDIVAISAGDNHTVGLRADGTAVAVGNNVGGQCNVSDWTDIVVISAGGEHTVGLRTDGEVKTVGNRKFDLYDAYDWKDITAVQAGTYNTVGLQPDGGVAAVGQNLSGQCDVGSWTDIVAASVGSFHTVGLRANGTAVAVGDNSFGQCDVSGWTDIVAISANLLHTVGLRADGTVVAVGQNLSGQCDVSDWTDIKTD